MPGLGGITSISGLARGLQRSRQPQGPPAPQLGNPCDHRFTTSTCTSKWAVAAGQAVPGVVVAEADLVEMLER